MKNSKRRLSLPGARSEFVGKQLSRFKMGMSYFTLATSIVTAVMTTKTSYPSLELEYLILLIPIGVAGTILAGYLLDRFDISTQDQRKSNEMTHRVLLTSDYKAQEFQLIQTKMLLTGLQQLKEGKEIEIDGIMGMYTEYLKKWGHGQGSFSE